MFKNPEVTKVEDVEVGSFIDFVLQYAYYRTLLHYYTIKRRKRFCSSMMFSGYDSDKVIQVHYALRMLRALSCTCLLN